MRIIITDLRVDPFTKRPVLITVTIFDQMGIEQFRTNLSAKMFKDDGRLEIGAELVLAVRE